MGESQNYFTCHLVKISVILNVHNGEHFIKRAIDSVINQTYQPLEIIIWDNCSTDGTKNIIRNYKNLIYYKSKIKTNLGEAREAARKVAKGDWIAYLDVDDYWYPNRLKEQIKFTSPEVGLIYAGVDEKNRNGKLLRKKSPLYKSGMLLAEQLRNFDIDMVTPLINNNLLNKNNLGFSKEMKASEEQDLFLKICAIATVVTIPKTLGVSTIREDSLTNKCREYWSIERNKTLDDLELILKTEEFSSAIKKARIQSEYYRASYLASIGDFENVRKIMRSLFNKRSVFKFLYLISFSPPLWNFLHRRSVKIVFTDFLKLNKNAND